MQPVPMRLQDLEKNMDRKIKEEVTEIHLIRQELVKIRQLLTLLEQRLKQELGV